MSWTTIYLLSVFIGGAALLLASWYELKTKKTESVTIGDILIGICFSLFPVLTVLIAIFVFMYLISKSTDIVVFGKKDQ